MGSSAMASCLDLLHPTPELKSTRRARIRLLTRLSRLTDAHSIDELRDTKAAPHAELVAILQTLAQKRSDA